MRIFLYFFVPACQLFLSCNENRTDRKERLNDSSAVEQAKTEAPPKIDAKPKDSMDGCWKLVGRWPGDAGRSDDTLFDTTRRLHIENRVVTWEAGGKITLTDTLMTYEKPNSFAQYYRKRHESTGFIFSDNYKKLEVLLIGYDGGGETYTRCGARD